MTFEEFEKANKQTLRSQAKKCFEDAQEGGRFHNTDLGRAALIEAQFYMQELDRRADSRTSRRDLILELVVIALIGGEIFLAVKAGRDEDKLMDKQNAILTNLQTSTASTASLLKEQLDIQNTVFVNAGFDGRGGVWIINNSKNEIYVHGLKVGDNRAVMNRDGPAGVAEHTEATLSVGSYYPQAFGERASTSPVIYPISLYLKNVLGEEFGQILT